MHPRSLARPLALTGALALALPLVGLAAASALAADADVRISEVESDDPAGGEDWVELVNTGSEPVDLSGWFLKDDDDSRDWTIPEGTVLEPGARLVLEHEKAVAGGFDFGLGKADEVRLFAADGSTEIDRLAWTEHAPTTYIVIDGEVAASAEPTRGEENSGPYVPPEVPADHPDAGAMLVTEVFSDGEDWVEVTNVSDREVDLSGWYLLDEKDIPAETPAVVPDGTVLAPGESHVFRGMPFGLGKGDQARLFTPDGVLSDGTGWPDGEHATPSWQLGADGAYAMSRVATPGAPNTVGDVLIHESNSSGSDFVELKNLGETPVDVSGHRILDSDDEHVHEIPAGSVLQPGELLLISGDELGYGLGGADMVRLQDPSGALLGQVAWSEHVTPSLALCEGAYVASGAATPGAENDCGEVEEVVGRALPTDGKLTVHDEADEWGEDLSGLDLQVLEDGSQVLWAVNNDAGQVSRLVQDESGTWQQAEGWPMGGKLTRFADGTGTPDGEGISVGEDGRIFVSAERDNDDKGTSRNTILAFDPASPEDELTAVAEWDLTSLLPATGANGGLEGIEMVPASALAQLTDDVPAAEAYALVVLEDTGDVHALALQADGTAELVATLASPLEGLMALDHDSATNTLWAFADEALGGRSVRYDLGAEDPAAESVVFERADGMPAEYANEGVALAPTELCADGVRQAWFADDADSEGHNLRGIGIMDELCGGDPDTGSEEDTGAGSGSDDTETGENSGGAGSDAGIDSGTGTGSDDSAEGGDGSGSGAGSGAGSDSGFGVGVSTDGGASGTGTTGAGFSDSAYSGGADSSAAPASVGAGSLARTGAEAAPLAAAAAALMAGGTWLVRRSRLSR
ncbi:lamin tail domain-containing protein [Brachybacterium paraconglomeratum]